MYLPCALEIQQVLLSITGASPVAITWASVAMEAQMQIEVPHSPRMMHRLCITQGILGRLTSTQD